MRSALFIAALVAAIAAPVLAGDPDTAFPDIVLPEAIHKVAARYPEKLRRAGIEGRVVLQATIGKDGRVTHPVVISSPAEQFSKAATAAVSKWRYRPARQHGEPIPVFFTIVVEFHLGKPHTERSTEACYGPGLSETFDEPPRLTTAPLVVDPSIVRGAPQSVTVDIDVCIDGSVGRFEAPGVENPILRSLTESTVRAWRFRPAMSGGHPVAVRQVIEIPIRSEVRD